MKILWNDKDGGPESKVSCWGLEIKSLFSVLVLRFDEGSRDALHTHAFNACSWLLTGGLFEVFADRRTRWHWPSLKPIITRREDFHQVHGNYKSSWALTFRGPWKATWLELLPGKLLSLTHGRKVLDEAQIP